MHVEQIHGGISVGPLGLSCSREQLDVLAELWSDFNKERIDRFEFIARIERSRSTVLFASRVVDGKPVGFAAGSLIFPPIRPTPIFELWALFVEPALRRKKIGHALLTAMEELARSLTCSDIHVSALLMPEVQSFYERSGYVIYATRMRRSIRKA